MNEGNLSAKWDSWIKDFEWHLQGQGTKDADDAIKVGKFMTTASPNAQSLFETFELKADQKGKYDEVKNAFKDYCNPRKRILY